jgi:hypothetical protein
MMGATPTAIIAMKESARITCDRLDQLRNVDSKTASPPNDDVKIVRNTTSIIRATQIPRRLDFTTTCC